MFMGKIPFGLIRSGLGTGVLVVALCFQMLPFYLLVLVAAFALGVSSGSMLAIIPVLFFVMVFALCWLAAKRVRHGPARPPSKAGRVAPKPRRENVVLIKTRAERYQDLKDALGQAWR